MKDEKQIEELAEDILQEFTNCYSEADKEMLAEMICNAGYRKQSEGEWIRRYSKHTDHLGTFQKYDGDFCSNCGELGDGKFCPNCGANMGSRFNYGTVKSQQEVIDKIKRETAKAIFAEIYEDCFDQFGYIDYDALIQLKKKYTGGE